MSPLQGALLHLKAVLALFSGSLFLYQSGDETCGMRHSDVMSKDRGEVALERKELTPAQSRAQ